MEQTKEDLPLPLGHSDSPPPAHGTSNHNGSAQISDFHRFPDLPKELRQLIFRACLPRRVFRFTYMRTGTQPKSTMDVVGKPPPIPRIAFVCRDAYEMAKLFARDYHVDCTDVISIAERLYIQGTTTIRFNPRLDTLLVNYIGITAYEAPGPARLAHERRLEDLHNGPYALAMMPGINLVLDMYYLVGPRLVGLPWSAAMAKWLKTKPFRDLLTQRSHCAVKLATTRLKATGFDIRMSGLFGMFGEERHVLVDIRDTVKFDQYEGLIDRLEPYLTRTQTVGWTYFPEGAPSHDSLRAMGAGRYGTLARSTLALRQTYHVDAFDVAEQDATSALLLIKQSWLEANQCFEPANEPLVPWTGDGLHRNWDDEHPVAKHWLSKLPEFSFVAMYIVIEET